MSDFIPAPIPEQKPTEQETSLCPVLIVLTINMKGIPTPKANEYAQQLYKSISPNRDAMGLVLGYKGQVTLWVILTKAEPTHVEVFNIGVGDTASLAEITAKMEAKLAEFFSSQGTK